MSLEIDTDFVAAVLLADGWHEVHRQSFQIDAYEFMEDGRCIVGGGTVDGVPSAGFMFHSDDGETYLGPLTAIQALRLRA